MRKDVEPREPQRIHPATPALEANPRTKLPRQEPRGRQAAPAQEAALRTKQTRRERPAAERRKPEHAVLSLRRALLSLGTSAP